MAAEVNVPTHRQKVDRLIADLGKQGVSPYTVAPPTFRILWAMGMRVPPPFFLGFLTLTLLMSTSFGVFVGPFIWLLQWQWPRPLEAVLGAYLGATLFAGLGKATYFRWKAARLRLPPWEEE